MPLGEHAGSEDERNRKLPRQMLLLLPAGETRERKRDRGRVYEDANRECAGIILADVERYGGEGSLAVRWARRVIERDSIVVPL